MPSIKNDGSYTASYNVDIARQLGSVNAAILLDKLNYLQRFTARSDGYCWRTSKELEQETALTERQQSLAIKKLEELGLIETKNTYIVGTHRKCKHFRVNMDNFDKLAKSDYDERAVSDYDIMSKSESDEMSKSVNNNYTLVTKHRTIPKGIGRTANDDTNPQEFGNHDINELFAYWADKTGLPVVAKEQRNRRAVWSMLRNKNIGKERIKHAIDIVAESLGDGYAPKVTSLFDLQQRFSDVLGYELRLKAKNEEERKRHAGKHPGAYSATASSISYERRPYDEAPQFREVDDTVDPEWLEQLKAKTFGGKHEQ